MKTEIKLHGDWISNYNLIQKDGMWKYGKQIHKRIQELLDEEPNNKKLRQLSNEIENGLIGY